MLPVMPKTIFFLSCNYLFLSDMVGEQTIMGDECHGVILCKLPFGLLVMTIRPLSFFVITPRAI